MIFGILNKGCSNFTKPLVLGQTSLTVKRYKRYVKTNPFRETRILPLKTKRRLKAFTQDVLVYVRTVLNGVGQLSSTWVGF